MNVDLDFVAIFQAIIGGLLLAGVKALFSLRSCVNDISKNLSVGLTQVSGRIDLVERSSRDHEKLDAVRFEGVAAQIGMRNSLDALTNEVRRMHRQETTESSEAS